MRIRIGGRDPHLDILHDDILDILELCCAKSPANRPDARFLVDRFAAATEKARHFLSSILKTTPIYVDNPKIRTLFSVIKAREMDQIAQFLPEVPATLDMLEKVRRIVA